MERDRYQRIKRLVMEADALPAERRAAFLDVACAGDAELRAQVERMLRPATLQTREVDVHEALGVAECATAGSPAAPAPGERVGPFEVVHELGRGGMGVVCAARDTRDGREVALKLVHAHLLGRPGLRERFAREARLGRRVDHENVVRTFETVPWERDGVRHEVLVMERVRGRNLRETLDDWGRLPEALVREIARQVAAGLAAIHAAGIVHRDLKPENVLLTDDQRVRIMDLGIAKVQETAFELTLEGQFVGSLGYAAPEQLQRGAIGPACDLYSLGVVLYELLTGTNPFRRDALGASVAAHLGERPQPAADREPDVSRFLSDVVDTLLARDPAQRFPSAEALGAVLADGEDGAWWTEREAVRPRRVAWGPRVERATSLHGRDEALAALRAAAARARAGDGRMVLIDGEAGIGRTRLLDAFADELVSAAAGSGGAPDVHVLYGAFPASGGLRGLTDAVEGAWGPGGVAAVVGEMLGSDAPGVEAYVALLEREPEAIDAMPLGDGVITSLCCRVLRQLAGERPVVWIVDDLQHAPPAARAAVLAMARTAETLPVLLVVATRGTPPADELAQLQRLPGFARHTLRRLSAKEVVELLEEALGSETLADRLGARIARRSDGVPFFVFEMLRALQADGGLERTKDGGYVLTRSISDVEVPAAIRDVVGARLDELTREERETLDVAAVAGVEFEAATVAQVLGRPYVRVLQDLAELQRRHGIVRSVGRGHQFDHHQFQEVLYADLPEPLRAEYHALIADTLAARAADAGDGRAAVTLARHHLRGSRPGAGLAHLERALEHLEACHRFEEAAELAEIALARGTLLDSRDRVGLHLRAANHHDVLGQRDAQLAHGQDALAHAERIGDEALLAGAHQALGIHAFAIHDAGESIARLRSSLAHAHAAGLQGLAGDVQVKLANALSLTRELDEARALLESAREDAARRGDGRREGEALRVTANVLIHQFRYDDALALAERARDLLEEAGDLRGAAGAHAIQGSLCWFLGRVDDARAAFQRCLEIGQRIGDRRFEVNARGRLGLASLHAGRLDEARRQFRHHRDGGVETGDAAAVGQALANLSQTESLLGDHEASLDCAARALQLAMVLDGRRLQAFAGAAVSSALRRLGRADEARAAAERAVAAARAADDVALESQALMELAGVADDEGDKARAIQILRDVAELARGTSTQIVDGAAIGLARLGAADPQAAVDAYLPHEAGLAAHQRLQSRHALWLATGDRTHLVAAHEALAQLRAHAPPDRRDAMVDDVPAYREITDAFAAAG